MSPRFWIIVGLVMVAEIGAAGVFLWHRWSAPLVVPEAVSPTASRAVRTPATLPAGGGGRGGGGRGTAQDSIPAATSPSPLPARPNRTATPPKAPAGNATATLLVPESVARAALDYVGADPDAQVVWATAINDPNMPAEDRQNLIEDLNENGFPNPDNVTANDLPLIANRLQLIEQMYADAMDDVNAAAFEEAYKDLTDMYQRASGRRGG